MRLPSLGRRGLPASEPGAHRRAARRTLALRLVLGTAIAAAGVFALVLARSAGATDAPLVPLGTTGMVVLDLSASVDDFRQISSTLRRIARADERAGLVIFSDAAYELLPPGAPGRELESLVRFFAPTERNGNVTFPVNPWATKFSAGTRISEGLLAGRAALLRADVKEGSILLMSDLDVTNDAERLGDVAAQLVRDGIELRVVPLNPVPAQRRIFEQIVGREAVVREARGGDTVAPPEERTLEALAPWGFVLVAAALIGLLALNERLLPRLEVRS